MKCTNCGTQNPDDAKHCRRCGAVLPIAGPMVQPTMIANDANRTQPLNTEAEITATRPLQESSSHDIATIQPDTSGSDATRPLPRAKMFFEPLPERALLADAHYKIG
ncbi:MAG TPA: zinc ribbon domain-containing protein, partial [Anaerolineae bacterium]|nr:zinc ribbon domain-containing protein [Anaerolineae bacterium]